MLRRLGRPWLVGAVAVAAAAIIGNGTLLDGNDTPTSTTSVLATVPDSETTTPSSVIPSTEIPTSSIITTATTRALDVQRCSNDAHGWSLEYPARWYTDDGGDPELTCTFFDAQPFTLELDTESDTPVYASWVQLDFESLVDAERDPTFATVLDQRDAVVDGRPAVVLLIEETGEGYYPEGWMRYEYLVDWGPQNSFLITLAGQPGDFFDGAVVVIDEMAASLDLAEPPS